MSGGGNGGIAARERLLLTVLGTNPQAAVYSLEGRQAEARLAPAALFDLLPETEKPRCALALCTPEAKRESLPLLEQELRGKCEVEPVDVSAGETQEDVNAYLAQVSNAVSGKQNVDLVVDVTHGWRHFSFLTYAAVLYLAALRGVTVRGAYYGLLRRDGPSPFLDLRPLLELPRWVHALETLRDTGGAAPMAGILGEKSNQKIARELSQFSQGHLSGLPLESGRAAHRIRDQGRKPLKKLLKDGHRLPLAGELVEQLATILEPFALTESVSRNGWKKRVVLSKQELKRQASIVDDLLEHGNIAAALGLMREWTVSWATWRLGGESEWLYRKVRTKATNILGAMAAIIKDAELSGVLTEKQCSLGDFWSNLSSLRNAYHHHGMRPQDLVGDKKQEHELCSIRKFWEGTLRSCPDFSLRIGESPGGRVLVSPIGMRPGVLFSALQSCRADGGEPAVCLVICSRETEGSIEEAARRAEYTGAIERLRLDDPYGGRSEIESLAKKARLLLIGAGEVLVNVTGGTTLMGLAAEELANAARRLACPVRRFGLIDRRPPQQQDAEPYRTGELFRLNSAEDGDDYRD